MPQQDEIGRLLQDLRDLRGQMMAYRDRLRPQLESMIHRTRHLRTKADPLTEASVLDDIHERLLSYQRGFEVGDCVRGVADPLAAHAVAGHGYAGSA